MQRVIHISSDLKELVCCYCSEPFTDGQERQHEIIFDPSTNTSILRIVHVKRCRDEIETVKQLALLSKFDFLQRHAHIASRIKFESPTAQMNAFTHSHPKLLAFLFMYESIERIGVTPVTTDTALQNSLASFVVKISSSHDLLFEHSLLDAESFALLFTGVTVFTHRFRRGEKPPDVVRLYDALQSELTARCELFRHSFWCWAHMSPGSEDEVKLILVQRPDTERLTELGKVFNGNALHWSDMDLSNYNESQPAWNTIRLEVRSELESDAELFVTTVQQIARSIEYEFKENVRAPDAQLVSEASIQTNVVSQLWTVRSNASRWSGSQLCYLIPNVWDDQWNASSTDQLIVYEGTASDYIPIMYGSAEKAVIQKEVKDAGLTPARVSFLRLITGKEC